MFPRLAPSEFNTVVWGETFYPGIVVGTSPPTSKDRVAGAPVSLTFPGSPMLFAVNLPQKHYVKKRSVKALREQLNTLGGPGDATDADALHALRKLILTSSRFSYGVRGASFTADDLDQIDRRARDVVSHAQHVRQPEG